MYSIYSTQLVDGERKQKKNLLKLQLLFIECVALPLLLPSYQYLSVLLNMAGKIPFALSCSTILPFP